MKIAVMQPYFFPYIGYFQLIKSVDKFIFYDDVNFIKNGWINRNRILINGAPSYFTVNLNGASPFAEIKDIKFIDNRKKLLKTLENTYRRAPQYSRIIDVIKYVFEMETTSVCDLAIESVKCVSKYLGLNTIFERSSEVYSDSKGMEKAERLKHICHQNNANIYNNPIGGTELYSKEDFYKAGIELNFIKTNEIVYNQFKNDFVSNLSILDVIMFNDVDNLNKILADYEFV